MAEIVFHAIPRDEVSHVVSGGSPRTLPRRANSLRELEMLLGEDVVGLLSEALDGREYSAIVVKDSQVRSFYAWVSTYLPGISPLSQLVRVITLSELRDVLNRKVSTDLRIRQAWVGVVLGECLSRTKDMRSFSGMSLAAAQSATSLPIAKMHSLGATSREYERALSRLAAIPLRNANMAGSLALNELIPIWSALSGHDLDPRRRGNIGSTVQDLLSSACAELAVDAKVSTDLLLAMAKIFEPSRDLTRFDAAPAEVRITIFDEIVSKRTANADASTELGQVQAFVIGYGASRIAIGGLKHLPLLDGLGGIENAAKVWFCLSCFITRRGGMSDPMVNLARLIDRELRYEFSAFQVPRHDVSWDEFLMLTVDEEQALILTELPKASPRSASIEIVPGASLVVSVGPKESPASSESASVKPKYDKEFISARLAELDAALAGIWQIRQSLVSEQKLAIGGLDDTKAVIDRKTSKRRRKAPDPSDLF